MKIEEATSNFLSAVIQSPEFQQSLENAVEKALQKHSTLFPPAQKLLTRKEVLEMLNMGSTMLHELTQNGTIPSYKIGKKVLYDVAQIRGTLPQFKRI